MIEPGTRELDRAAFATIAGSFVPCPLKAGAQIAAGRCVEWQQENGCHCEHALPSLRRVEKHLVEEPARKANPGDAHLAVVEAQRLEQLDGVRAQIERAEAIEKARPPPPPPRPALKEQKPASAPAKEPEMVLVSDLSDDAIRHAFTAGGGSINKTMEKLGTTSWAAVKERCDALGLKAERKAKAAPKANGARPLALAKPAPHPRPRTVADVAAKHVALAPSDDVVAILVAKLAFHVEQAAKIEKALEVLRA